MTPEDVDLLVRRAEEVQSDVQRLTSQYIVRNVEKIGEREVSLTFDAPGYGVLPPMIDVKTPL